MWSSASGPVDSSKSQEPRRCGSNRSPRRAAESLQVDGRRAEGHRDDDPRRRRRHPLQRPLDQAGLRVRERLRLARGVEGAEIDRRIGVEDVVLLDVGPQPGHRGRKLFLASERDGRRAASEDVVPPVAGILDPAGRGKDGRRDEEACQHDSQRHAHVAEKTRDGCADEACGEREGEDQVARGEPRLDAAPHNHEQQGRDEEGDRREGDEGRSPARENDGAENDEREGEPRRPALPAGGGRERAHHLAPGVFGRRQLLLAVETDPKTVSEPDVGPGKGQERNADREHGEGWAERPAAPEHEGDDRFRRHEDRAVGVNRRQEPGGERGDKGCLRPVRCSTARTNRVIASVAANAYSEYMRPKLP